MHIQCPTDRAIFLLGVFDAAGIMRFPDDGHPHGGIVVRPQRPLPIDPQLVEAALPSLPERVPATAFSIYQEFGEQIHLPGFGDVTVYLGQLAKDALQAPADWPSFPDLIRRLPKDRTRLPYLRAWQVLTGGLKLDTRAVEDADLNSLFGGESTDS